MLQVMEETQKGKEGTSLSCALSPQPAPASPGVLPCPGISPLGCQWEKLGKTSSHGQQSEAVPAPTQSQDGPAWGSSARPGADWLAEANSDDHGQHRDIWAGSAEAALLRGMSRGDPCLWGRWGPQQHPLCNPCLTFIWRKLECSSLPSACCLPWHRTSRGRY